MIIIIIQIEIHSGREGSHPGETAHGLANAHFVILGDLS